MIETVLSCLIGITVIISALLLCAGCRETKNAEKECNGDASLLQHHGSDREKAVHSPDKAEINHILKDGSLSRMSSVSSHASVRITLTNAEIENDVESPVSNVSSYMADRELPELPKCHDEDEDHDYDTVENLPNKNWVRYQPPEKCPEYDTLDVLKEAEYYTLGDVSDILDKPEYATVDNLQPEYATVANLQPEYAKVAKKPEYATVDNLQPEYATVDNLKPEYAKVGKKPEYATVNHLQISTEEAEYAMAKKASYEVLPDDIIPRTEHRTEHRTLSPRPFSEGFLSSDLENLSSVIDKNRSGSERKARENEDSMSVIYASINPDFRKQRLSEEELEQHYSIVSNEDSAPPLPENPYAMLDSLLADLKIPQPGSEALYEDLENMRPTSTNIEGIDFVQRKVNPIIANSSPFAIVNPSRTASQITDVEDEIL